MPWGDLLSTTIGLAIVAVPLGVSLWALLDAARRPQWAWSLAERNQALWMAMILLGMLSVVLGLVVSGWYLWRIRPIVAAGEAGVPAPRRRHGTDESRPE